MGALGLSDTANTLLTCVEGALNAGLRPVCKSYQTVGTPVIFNCCECDEGMNGELSIHFTRLFDADPSSLLETVRIRPCRGGIVAAQFRLVLARCYPMIDEHGEIPSTEFLDESAEDLHLDSELMWQSLACCTGLDLKIDDLSVDLGPKGGCSVVYADVTAQVRVPSLPDNSSG